MSVVGLYLHQRINVVVIRKTGITDAALTDAAIWMELGRGSGEVTFLILTRRCNGVYELYHDDVLLPIRTVNAIPSLLMPSPTPVNNNNSIQRQRSLLPYSLSFLPVSFPHVCRDLALGVAAKETCVGSH